MNDRLTYPLRMGVLLAMSTMAGCGGGKPDVVAQPHVTWLIAHPQKIAADKFQEEVAMLFAPFRADTECGPRAVFPQVDAVWQSGTSPVSTSVVGVDPAKLATAHQNMIQKLFGKKANFGQMEKLAREQITKETLPDSLTKDGLQFAGSSSLQQSVAGKQPYDLVALRMPEGAPAIEALRQVKLGGTAKAVAVGAGPEKLQAELLAAICASKDPKDATKTLEILVIDGAIGPVDGTATASKTTSATTTTTAATTQPVQAGNGIGIAPSDKSIQDDKEKSQRALQLGKARDAEMAANRAAANELIKSAIAKLAQANLAGADKDLQLARELDPRQPLVYYNIGVLRLRQGSRAAAIDSFEQSFKSGFNAYDLMAADKDLDVVRKDPRFQELLKRYPKAAS